jgi:hypothetical protein
VALLVRDWVTRRLIDADGKWIELRTDDRVGPGG